jgi:predicted metal-dependent phosphoesterase TrpH
VIDLHSHSTASDGSESPAALVALAARRGLSALALTDHDTTSGLGEAEDAAAEAGIRLVRGVEIEIDFRPGEFHLLGLGFGPSPKPLEGLLTDWARNGTSGTAPSSSAWPPTAFP